MAVKPHRETFDDYARECKARIAKLEAENHHLKRIIKIHGQSMAMLEAENQRLREALEKIANHRTISDTGTEYGFFDLKDIAKQAIAEVDNPEPPACEHGVAYGFRCTQCKEVDK